MEGIWPSKPFCFGSRSRTCPCSDCTFIAFRTDRTLEAYRIGLISIGYHGGKPQKRLQIGLPPSSNTPLLRLALQTGILISMPAVSCCRVNRIDRNCVAFELMFRTEKWRLLGQDCFVFIIQRCPPESLKSFKASQVSRAIEDRVQVRATITVSTHPFFPRGDFQKYPALLHGVRLYNAGTTNVDYELSSTGT